MITPQQSALASREKIQGYLKQQWKELIRFSISGMSSVGLLGLALLSWKNDISPELTVASGLGALGCHIFALIELSRLVNTCHETLKEQAGLAEMGGSIPAIIAPLAERLPLEEKKMLTVAEAPMAQLQLLPSGQPDSVPTDLEVPQSDELSALAGSRITALIFIVKQLLDPRVKSVNLRGPEERIEILKQLQPILAAPPRSSGSSLTGPETWVLSIIADIGAMTERAPKTMVAYLEWIGVLIESYILNSRLPPGGKAMADDLMTAAVRAEIFTGVAVAPPIAEWKKAQDLKDEEAAKVVLTEHQMINFAKDMVIIGNNRAPDAREAFLKILPGLKNLLQKEKERLERLNQINVEPNIELAAINTVLAILDISMEKLVDKGTIDMLNQLFGNRLSGKSRIAPRGLMKEFENTGLGFWSIEGDRIIVVAKTISLADVLACAAVICYPHIPRIEICIKKDINEDNKKDRKIVDQSAVTPTGVFYFQRFIGGNRQYVGELIKEQSPKAEPMRLSPVSALLADVSV